MNRYGAYCDDTYVNMHLTTEMDLPQSRESLLHFFEQVQRRFPKLSNFYARERSEYCLKKRKRAVNVGSQSSRVALAALY